MIELASKIGSGTVENAEKLLQTLRRTRDEHFCARRCISQQPHLQSFLPPSIFHMYLTLLHQQTTPAPLRSSTSTLSRSDDLDLGKSHGQALFIATAAADMVRNPHPAMDGADTMFHHHPLVDANGRRNALWFDANVRVQSSSTVSPPSTTMRSTRSFERKVEEMKPSKR